MEETGSIKLAILLGDSGMETLGRGRALAEAALAARPAGARVAAVAIGLPVIVEAQWRNNADFLRDGLSGVVVRRLSWQRVLAGNARRMFEPLGLPVSLQGIDRVTLPRDWGTNFLDCDHWMVVAGPDIGGVYPARPTAMFCDGLAMRRHPFAFAPAINAPYWHDQTAAFRLWRQSTVAVATDPLTAGDLVSYAGVRPDRVMCLSQPLDPELPTPPAGLSRDPGQLLIVVEPDDLHGTDVVFKALRRYISEGGALRPTLATEGAAEAFGKNSQIPQVAYLPEAARKTIEALPIERIVSHQRWSRLLARAGNVWITRRAGGDGALMRQALRSGARVLAPDTPQTRQASALAGGDLTLIGPGSVDDAVDRLHAFEAAQATPAPAPISHHRKDELSREIGFVVDRLREGRHG